MTKVPDLSWKRRRTDPQDDRLWAATAASGIGKPALAFAVAVFTRDELALLWPWAQALALGIPSGALGGTLTTLTRPLLGATVAIAVLVFIRRTI